MKLIQLFVRTIDGLNTKIGHVISWLSTILVLTVCYDVFTRYFLRKSSVGVQEMEWHIFAVLFLLAAAYTLKVDNHVRVDVIYTQLSPRGKAWINMLGGIIFLIPFSILVIWASKGFISMSWAIQETSPDPGGLPYRYLLKAMIPVGFSLLLLQGIAQILRSFCTVIGRPMEDSNSKEIKEQHHA
ncbi:TRAP transporter small permease subunit [uncultured Desulfuromusa sp.]|uniref:TRAP transporter small permease subunit n=1 Tax=uncultured Desulfuromusa sp. TaxID=219183 RepID=UPI002AA69198|nr:TRAP transporter small permease subunit [uncultured Desulfuromusa sp.]